MTNTALGILTAILAVFTAVGEWIVTAVTAMVPLFFAEGALTFLGVLAVSGLAFSVVFLNSTLQSKEGALIVKSMWIRLNSRENHDVVNLEPSL